MSDLTWDWIIAECDECGCGTMRQSADPKAVAAEIMHAPSCSDYRGGFITGDWSVTYPKIEPEPRNVFPRHAMRLSHDWMSF